MGRRLESSKGGGECIVACQTFWSQESEARSQEFGIRNRESGISVLPAFYRLPPTAYCQLPTASLPRALASQASITRLLACQQEKRLHLETDELRQIVRAGSCGWAADLRCAPAVRVVLVPPAKLRLAATTGPGGLALFDAPVSLVRRDQGPEVGVGTPAATGIAAALAAVPRCGTAPHPHHNEGRCCCSCCQDCSCCGSTRGRYWDCCSKTRHAERIRPCSLKKPDAPIFACVISKCRRARRGQSKPAPGR
jgi:hypothetical protein